MKSIQENFWTTKINQFHKFLLKNFQSRSLTPLHLGPPCCLEDLYLHEYSLDQHLRVNDIVYSPFEADLLLISGIITEIKIPFILESYEQIPPPKWIITLGDCTKFNSKKKNQNIQNHLKIDVHIPGCPPKFDHIIDGIEKLQQLIRKGDT